MVMMTMMRSYSESEDLKFYYYSNRGLVRIYKDCDPPVGDFFLRITSRLTSCNILYRLQMYLRTIPNINTSLPVSQYLQSTLYC